MGCPGDTNHNNIELNYLIEKVLKIVKSNLSKYLKIQYKEKYF